MIIYWTTLVLYIGAYGNVTITVPCCDIIVFFVTDVQYRKPFCCYFPKYPCIIETRSKKIIIQPWQKFGVMVELLIHGRCLKL